MTALPFGLGPAGFAILAVGLLAAAFSRGYSGFGFSALVVASGSLVTDPVKVVPLAIVLEVAASALQAAAVWRHVDWKQVAGLCAGALIGNPLGVALLAWLSSNSLRVAIAVFIASASAALLSGRRLARPPGSLGHAAIGLASGTANGATALGGLPVALFLVAGQQAPAVIRANLVAFFFLTDLYAGALFAGRGILDGETVHAALWTAPLLLVGLGLGNRHFVATTPETFRRFVLVLLIGLSLLVLAKAGGFVG